MYILYGGKFTRTLMVEMVLAEIGVSYELREVNTFQREHRSEEFLKVNPAGWVPALITPDGDQLYETQAINLYLAERHGAEHLAPGTRDPLRGRFLSALFYLSGELEPAIKRFFFPHRYSDGEAHAAFVRQRAQEACRGCFEVIEGRLVSDGPYHLGERFSLLDIVLAHWVRTLDEEDLFRDLSALAQNVDLVMARPKLKPAFAKLDLWMDDFNKLAAGTSDMD